MRLTCCTLSACSDESGTAEQHLFWYLPLFPMSKTQLCFAATATAAKSLQSYPTLCDPIEGSPPGSPSWDSPGKNTGVGCHFLLQVRILEKDTRMCALL